MDQFVPAQPWQLSAEFFLQAFKHRYRMKKGRKLNNIPYRFFYRYNPHKIHTKCSYGIVYKVYTIIKDHKEISAAIWGKIWKNSHIFVSFSFIKFCFMYNIVKTMPLTDIKMQLYNAYIIFIFISAGLIWKIKTMGFLWTKD